MRRRAALPLALLALGLAAGAARADLPAPPIERLLLASSSPLDLRARLVAHADSIVRTNPQEAGEALYWAGVSQARAGHPDSAIAVLARALATRGAPAERLLLAELLAARGRRGDADSARAVLAAFGSGAALFVPGQDPTLALLRAWLRLERLPRALHALWSPPRSPLWGEELDRPGRAPWAMRLAPVALESGDGEAAWRLATWTLVRSAGLDTAALAFARPLAAQYATEPLDAWLTSHVDRTRAEAIAALVPLSPGALVVRAEDGAVLRGGVINGPPDAPLALLAPPAEAATLAAFDSLAAQLVADGLSVAWLDPRGVRGSSTAACPLPEAWDGREQAGEERAARDLSLAIGPAARLTHADSTRVLVVGAGTSAMPAVLAAQRDPRVRALLLAAPAPSPAEHGWLRAALRASGVPVYLQTGPQVVDSDAYVDALVLELPARQFRVADSQDAGEGADVFRAGGAVAERFRAWLEAAWTSPRATPPRTRR